MPAWTRLVLLTCTVSPLTIRQLLGDGNMALMAFKGLLGTAAGSTTDGDELKGT
jgi:hypothetical protein